jgi:hypothetical protein
MEARSRRAQKKPSEEANQVLQVIFFSKQDHTIFHYFNNS